MLDIELGKSLVVLLSEGRKGKEKSQKNAQ
jgi:hypothetical protein